MRVLCDAVYSSMTGNVLGSVDLSAYESEDDRQDVINLIQPHVCGVQDSVVFVEYAMPYLEFDSYRDICTFVKEHGLALAWSSVFDCWFVVDVATLTINSDTLDIMTL
jgi:hypothetical protein